MNKEGRFYGTLDVPVNETGIAQAEALAKRLENRPIHHIYSSTLQRARQTAEIGTAGHNLPITTDARLVEIAHGRWEGVRFDEAEALDPDTWAKWRRNEIDNPHGGETLHDAVARVTPWVEEITAKYTNGETIACFAHGGALQAVMCVLLKIEPNPVWQFRFGNCSVAELLAFPHGNVLISFG